MSSPYRFRSAPAATALVIGALAVVAGCTAAEGGTAGKLIDARDEQGHQYREVPEKGAPQVMIVLRPAVRDGWDLQLTVHHFRFSAAPGRRSAAVAERGQAQLYLDGRPLALLHVPRYHLASRLLTRGTHQVTARLYADDRTVWAVHGKPVQSTAALTASR